MNLLGWLIGAIVPASMLVYFTVHAVEPPTSILAAEDLSLSHVRPRVASA